MQLDTWIYYTLAILVLTASPGPSSLLCLSKGVSSGFRLALTTALGSLSAITIILTLSFTGLGVVIASSEFVFNIIKWCGAAYLIWLGIQAFRSKQNDFSKSDSAQVSTSHVSAYTSGFIVGSSNPKAIIFFTALFPQFIDPTDSLLTQYAIFAGTFVVFELSWLTFYALLGVKTSNWLFEAGRAKLFNRLTGGVFISAGVMLSTANRS
ncbi:TPA: LysE family translocator [Vibrio parahaemolyticus]|uniref:LysE family translocator n=1 Tax=Vibrio parahaemolyticus TaxID=670 RepID=A0AA47L8D5_VIBPH|nr:LysE family translocator [Vibrio parahaemolyticus]BDP35087.1 flagellar biosynthesis protein FlgM [Vibrio alginolyticus]AHI99507.1 putative homoserine/homoserine lactone efflux protein [Vibrio parahaemolyticus UCM-V493]EHH1059798.1 LysE family translocator [Vibrio parahaemolyticus]EHH1241744.1 LysE family translocator [Vibrio parahaemolyticus]EHH2502499.1 LysE family translocator [Vibrio parahaemolyticus]